MHDDLIQYCTESTDYIIICAYAVVWHLQTEFPHANRFIFQVGLYSTVSEIVFYCNVPSFDMLYDKAYLFSCTKIIYESDVSLRSYHRDMVLSLEGSYNMLIVIDLYR